MSDYFSMTGKYTYLWSKYRPAILKLMIDSANGPQEYKFSRHEFQNVNPKEKGGYSFVLRVFQGKAVNDIRVSAIAKDLLSILQQSKKATELVDSTTYEFTMDKQFMFHIKQEASPIEAEEAEVS